MKKMLACAIALLLLFSAVPLNASAKLVEDGTYWTNVSPAKLNELVDAAMEPGGEGFVLVYYSRLCEWCQTYVPQFRDYCESKGVHVYAMDMIAEENEPTVAYHFGVNSYLIAGKYPIIVRYWGNGAKPAVTDSVRSLDAFVELLNAQAPKAGEDGLIFDGDTIIGYNGDETDLIIPAGVKAIGDAAFRENAALRSVTIPEGVESVGHDAFFCCSNLERVELPKSLRSIGCMTFFGTALREIALPEGITVIPIAAFEECRSLRSVTLPSTLTKIDERAFEGADLRDITIPAGVSRIEKAAFGRNSNLHTVRFLGNMPEIAYDTEKPVKGYGAAFYYITGGVAGVFPAGNSTWTSNLEMLKSRHPNVNWGGLPGQRCAVESLDLSKWDADGTLADWARDEVLMAASCNIGSVYDKDETTGYNRPINRGGFCVLLMDVIRNGTGVSCFDLDEAAGDPFDDTKNTYVRAAHYLGIVTGKGERTFDPYGTISRQEAATMLARAAKYMNVPSAGGTDFADGGQIAAWAQASVSYVAGVKSPVSGKVVMGGTGGGNFSPLGTYTLQEAYCSFLRLLQAKLSR